MVTRGDSIRPNSVSCFDAVRELFQRIKAALPDGDPAPWCEVSESAIALFAGDDRPGYIRSAKLHDRTKLLLQRGLLSGELRAHFCDGTEAIDVPGWAWAESDRLVHVWHEGRLPLDVFLPDEWQRWSAHSVFLNRESFMAWVEGKDLSDVAGLPDLPAPYDAALHPLKVSKRLPPDNPFVTLSEALSWIAFSFSMDSDQLDHAIQAHAIDGVDMEQELAAAVAKLATKAAGGLIELRGKYVERRGADEANVRTKRIEPESLEDFAQFDIIYDGLAYGSGLTWVRQGSALDRVLNDGQRDSFRRVKVKRADLLKHFPDCEDLGRATFVTMTQQEERGQTGNGRRRPGPAPDPDWPHAIAKVTQDCIAAGYTQALKRGDKAAIQTMLLSYMADKDKHFSVDIAAKHAKAVIDALPDN